MAGNAVFAGSPRAFFARIASSSQPFLSHCEEFLWWSARLAGDTTFNVRVVLRLTGPLRRPALDASIVEIARRHETLRTVFPMEDGVVRRHLLPPDSARPVFTDLEPSDPATREAEAWRLVLEESNRSFNLARGPLFRSRILRVGPDNHLLQFTIHHLVIDGRSVDILLRELGVLYGAYSQDGESPLEELPVQYAAHAAGRKRALSGATLERTLAYWRAQLAGSPSLLALPTDAIRRTARHYPGHTLTFALDADRTAAVHALARRHGTTTFVFLLSLLKLLLYRLSGNPSIAVEAPLGNRRSLEAEGLIGLLVDLVPLRTVLSGDSTLAELLAAVRRTTLGAFDHAGIPIHALVSAVDVNVDPSHSAICQVMFNLINRQQRAVHLASLQAEQLPLPDSPHSKFDMMLTAHLTDALGFQLLYRRDLFSEARMHELVEQYKGLIDQALAAPDARIEQYSLVTPGNDPVPRRRHRGSALQLREMADLFAAEGVRPIARDLLNAIGTGSSELTVEVANGASVRFNLEALAEGAAWTAEACSMEPGTRVGVLPGAGVSALLQAVSTALYARASLCLPPAGEMTARDLWAWLDEGIAIAFGEPAAWRRLKKTNGRLASLRGAVFTGGVLVREDVHRVRALSPGVECLYFSGFDGLPQPSSGYQVGAGALEIGAIVPLGRGLAGSELVVLNRCGQPAGTGELGEIHVRNGRQRPTGFLGRFLPDGTIDRLGGPSDWGSVDGYTIRFDEVASALMRHPDVLDARVAIDTNESGPELVAHLVSDDERPWPGETVESFVSDFVPGYMVPRRIVRTSFPPQLDHNPLRPSFSDVGVI